jgi:D-inositol-3-phosphate glycosyltransferase
VKIALLTGGQDPPYACGLLRQLLGRGVHVVCVGNDELAHVQASGAGSLEFHNLVGSQGPDHLIAQVWRVLRYYARLAVFAARTDARVFHILWFRKFPWLERTIFNLYFKLLGKRLVFTAHNVDDQARDGRGPGLVNHLSLSVLYRIVDHVLVHTPRMKRELVERFHLPDGKITVVPFGINNVIPRSTTSRATAKERLSFEADQRVLLFFGNIAPYKGIEDLILALARLVEDDKRFTLLIAGPVKDKGCASYWRRLEGLIEEYGLAQHVRKEIRYIPDEEVGLFFNASDVSVLPYRQIYQSGVLALSYAQGLPVIVADVGSLRDEVLENETGLIYRSGDVHDLAAKVRMYFESGLYKELETREPEIRQYGEEHFSWATNAEQTCAVYEGISARWR